MDRIDSAMRQISQGVYILGVKTEHRENLMTAAWLTQISDHPNTLLVAVAKSHYTAALIEVAGAFSVSILAAGQEDVARKCGFVSGRDVDKLDGIEITRFNSGAPLIVGAAAHLNCQLTTEIDVGDHMLFVGGVTAAEVFERQPLIYHNDDYFG
ncbi:flavin reductase family protein [Caproiciproducens sp.]